MGQHGIVSSFFTYLTQSNYVKAIDFMERQGRMVLWHSWPKPLAHILCDFALAEKNYYDTNFEPVRNKTAERKEDKDYLNFVYKTFYQDLENLQVDMPSDGFVSQLITSLLLFISVRLKLLEFYDKLYEIGSSNCYIDFNELAEVIDIIQCECSCPIPLDGILKILQHELDCMKHLFRCHDYLENWMYLESVLSLKKGSDALGLWEKCYQHKKTWILGSLLKKKIILPPLVSWFKKFKLLTLSKFTLYFYGVLIQHAPLHEIKNLCNNHSLNFFTKMQQLQRKSEARYVILVFDTSHLSNYKGPGYWSPERIVVDSYIKYQIMLSFPKVPVKIDMLETLISGNNEKEVSLNDIDLINFENGSYLLMRVDLRITLIMFYDYKPKNDEKEKANMFEFVSQLRCHKLFTTVYR